MATIKVLIEINGGLVQCVSSNVDVEYTIIDWDKHAPYVRPFDASDRVKDHESCDYICMECGNTATLNDGQDMCGQCGKDAWLEKGDFYRDDIDDDTLTSFLAQLDKRGDLWKAICGLSKSTVNNH